MNLYLDASVIVKLLIEEPGSDEAEQIVATAEGVTTCLISYAEVRSALARKAREGGLLSDEHARVASAFEADWDRYAASDMGSLVVRLAGDLAQRRALRALDALHLASALFLQSSGNIPIAFLSADRRLQEAAEAEGLEVFTLSS